MTGVLQLLFIDKPYHIDDYLFVRVARATERFPLAPYGGPDNFTGVSRDLAIHNNPPLVPAVLAATMAVVGESPRGLHLSLLPFTVVAAAAFAWLCGRFCARPLAPSLLWAGGVPLVLSGSHLMSDVPALGLALGGTALTLAAADGPRHRWLWPFGGLLLGAAAVAKYSMLFFLLYVPVVAAFRGLTRGRVAGVALIAALPSFVWAIQSALLYGEPHVLLSGRQGAESPLGLEWMAGWWIEQKALAVLAELGQFGAPMLLTVLLASRWKPRWQLLVPAISGIWLCTKLPGYGTGQLVQFGAWAALGVAAILAPLRGMDRDDRVLMLWFYPFLALTVLVLPFASVRFVLPTLPPLILMLWRQAERLGIGRLSAACCVVLTVAWSFLASVADERYSRLYAGLADAVAKVARTRGETLWFAAEGGLRPELERHGALYLRSRVDSLPIGSLVAMGVNCHHYALSPKLSTQLYEDQVFDATVGLPLRLESSEARAGFYAHPNGYLPVAISDAVAESVYLFRVGPPNPFARQFLEARDRIVVQGEIVENVHQFKRGFWPSFRAHPPSIVRFHLDAADTADAATAIRFGFGLREEVSGPSYGDGVTFRVRGRRTDRPEPGRILYEKYIDPKNVESDRQIHQARAELGNLAGGPVELDFENDCGPRQDCRYDWALWTMPELVKGGVR